MKIITVKLENGIRISLRYFILLPAILISSLTNGQTLTSIDLNPQLGDVFKRSSGQYTVPSSGGQGQTWDYINLGGNNGLKDTILPIATVKSSSLFPGTNMVRGNLNGWTYLNVNTNALELLGTRDGSGLFVEKFGDSESLLQYPLHYGQTMTDAFTSTLTANGATSHCTGTRNYTVDAEGAILCKAGYYTNAYRVHMMSSRNFTNITTQSVTTITEDFYYWYVAGTHDPVFYIYDGTKNGSNSGQGINHLYNNPNMVGIESNSEKDFVILVYPNPAHDILNLDIQNIETYRFELLNSMGTLVQTGCGRGNNITQIDLSDFAKGIYSLKIFAEEQKYLTKKIVVQ